MLGRICSVEVGEDSADGSLKFHQIALDRPFGFGHVLRLNSDLRSTTYFKTFRSNDHKSLGELILNAVAEGSVLSRGSKSTSQ